jgi:protein-L-isoaspartate(D-aspartate) O-methyltransferase
MSADAKLRECRRRLLADIEAETLETQNWTGRARISPLVMAAIARVPREEFVPLMERPFAYDNRPLAIGHGQTISQPFIVAIMTDLLDLTGEDRVLEIGTGCGYQAAVLAELAAKVCTVEVVRALGEDARRRLARLGYTNIATRIGDGWLGWPEEAPFDAIIVTAAPPELPPALVQQLKPEGRMVIPIGPRHEGQMLYRYIKRPDGTLDAETKLPVAFVPMIDAS